MGNPKRTTARLAIAALGVHAMLFVAIYFRAGGLDSYAFRSRDAAEYYRIAQNLAEHGAFSQANGPPYLPDTWRTPGYPLFLALLMICIGDSPLLLIGVQQILSVVNVVLFLHIARGSMSNRAALMAALLFLLEPYHLLYSTWLLATTLLLTALLLAWLLWQTVLATRNRAWLMLLGVVNGALVLIWPGSVLIPLSIVVGIVWMAQARSRKVRSRSPFADVAKCLAAFILPFASVAGTWMMRNHQVTGHFRLSHQSGVVLAYFKAAEVVLWRQGRAADRYLETSTDPVNANLPHSVWSAIDRELRLRMVEVPDTVRDTLQWSNLVHGNKTDLDSFRVSDELRRIGWSYLRESPAETIACYVVRMGENLTFPLNLAIAPAAGVAGGRLSWGLKAMPYATLCLLLVVRLARPGLTFANAFYPLMTTVALMLTTTPQIDPRFRVPMIPLLLFVVFLPRTPRPLAAGTQLEAV